MIWVEDETTVVVTLDSVSAWDHRQNSVKHPDKNNYSRFRELMGAGKEEEAGQILRPVGTQPTKTYVGRLVVDVGRKILGEARLSVHGAEVELEVRTDDGETIHLKFVAYANVPAIAVDRP